MTCDLRQRIMKKYCLQIINLTFHTETFVTFTGRKKRRGQGYLLMAGAVLAGESFLENSEISR